jgi:hypothetical protein
LLQAAAGADARKAGADDQDVDVFSGDPFETSRSEPCPSTSGAVRTVARTADLLLVAFLVCLALTTAAQLRHNEAVGPHHGAPYDRPVAHRPAP